MTNDTHTELLSDIPNDAQVTPIDDIAITDKNTQELETESNEETVQTVIEEEKRLIEETVAPSEKIVTEIEEQELIFEEDAAPSEETIDDKITEASSSKDEIVFDTTVTMNEEDDVEAVEADAEMDGNPSLERGTFTAIVQRETNGWLTVTLPSMLTIRHINDLKAELAPCLGQRIYVIGQCVEQVDTAALQLLTALLRHPSVTMGWGELSPTLSEAITLLGLESHLCIKQT